MRGFIGTVCGLGTATACGWQKGQHAHVFGSHFFPLEAWSIGTTVVLAAFAIFYMVGSVAVIFWVFTSESHLSIKVDMVVESLKLPGHRDCLELGIAEDVIKRAAGSKVFLSAPTGAYNSSVTPTYDKVDDKIKDEPYYAKLTREYGECRHFDPADIRIVISDRDWKRASRKIPELEKLKAVPAEDGGFEFKYADMRKEGATKKLSTLVPNSKLGNRLIAHLLVQQFVDLLSIVSLGLSCFLLYTLEKAAKYVGALLGLQVLTAIFSKIGYAIIMTAFTRPVVANAVDGLAQRNGICYTKKCRAREQDALSNKSTDTPQAPASEILEDFKLNTASSPGTCICTLAVTTPCPYPPQAPASAILNSSPGTSTCTLAVMTPWPNNTAACQTPRASSEPLDPAQGKWMTIVWNTRSEDPRRKFWCKSEGIGVHYSEAVDAAEDAYKLTDEAIKSSTFLCVAYITVMLAIIAVYLAGSDVIAQAPVTVLGIVVALASTTLSYSCLSLLQLANAAVHARRARNTINSINEGITLASMDMVRSFITGAKLTQSKANNIAASVDPSLPAWDPGRFLGRVHSMGRSFLGGVASLGRIFMGRVGYMCRFVYIPVHLHLDKHRNVDCKIIIYDAKNTCTDHDDLMPPDNSNPVNHRDHGSGRSLKSPASNIYLDAKDNGTELEMNPCIWPTADFNS